MTQGPAFVSWSGGKDSCLALDRAARDGLRVTHLVTVFDETGERTRSHAVPRAVMGAQARALGFELVSPSASWADYERVFVGTLEALRADGVRCGVFGDIDLEPHRAWEERVCALAGVTPILPLWDEPRAALAQEVLERGIKAVVVCVNGAFLGPEFCGLPYDRDFLQRLPAGVDACGENGEFHTFVFDGPMFAARVSVRVGAVYSQPQPASLGGGTYHFAPLTLG